MHHGLPRQGEDMFLLSSTLHVYLILSSFTSLGSICCAGVCLAGLGLGCVFPQRPSYDWMVTDGTG